MRSPMMMSADNSALMVIDIQEKLAAVMEHREQVVRNTGLLVEAAGLLEVPVLVTEQYRKGLGPTVPELAERLPEPVEKLTFSCCGPDGVLGRLQELQVSNVLLAGMESHICVMQTALDLQAAGFGTYVAVDAVCSRRRMDWQYALNRMRHAGVVLTSSEAAIFEWLRIAGTDVFRKIVMLVK